MEELLKIYPVIDTKEIAGVSIPVLDIPQISDEEWQRIAQAQKLSKAV